MTDPIARLNAALEGRYAIERELGEGGMATVYLADDLKHHGVPPTVRVHALLNGSPADRAMDPTPLNYVYLSVEPAMSL